MELIKMPGEDGEDTSFLDVLGLVYKNARARYVPIRMTLPILPQSSSCCTRRLSKKQNNICWNCDEVRNG